MFVVSLLTLEVNEDVNSFVDKGLIVLVEKVLVEVLKKIVWKDDEVVVIVVLWVNDTVVLVVVILVDE
jgi:hypothetical protein